MKRIRRVLLLFLTLCLLVLSGCAPREAETDGTAPTDTLAGMHGKKIGVMTGSVYDQFIKEQVPDCTIEFINVNTDLAVALDAGKIDAYLADEPMARYMLAEYPDQYICAQMVKTPYAFIFQKNNEKSDHLRAQMNEFLAELRADGTLDALGDLWYGSTDDSKHVIDREGMNGENGTLTFAVSSDIGVPITYVKDGQCVGYDIDIAVRFCKRYGYRLEIADTNVSGMLAGVAAGRFDFGAGSIAITPEREEAMNFSDPDYDGSIVLVAKRANAAGREDGFLRFLRGIRDSFHKTFVREGRYRLFLSGLGVTALVTVVSAFCGTMLGFMFFLLYRRRLRLTNAILNVWMDVMQKTPVVLILMILYYLVFGSFELGGVWVSVIGFSMLFSCAVIGLLKTATGAVEEGQMEAALALGYTEVGAFLRIILPQAMRHFFPGYISEIVSLIKSTAIVGYIAVQDLTKVSDIVRSRTYEAFFPLVVSAVIYYLYAWLMTAVVLYFRRCTDPKRRTREQILKGVNRK